MTIRLKHIAAVMTVLTMAGGGGGGDKVREALDSLKSFGRDVADDRVLDLAEALVPRGPGVTTPPEITLELDRAADDTVTVTVTRDPAGPEFEALASEPFDGVWTRAGAQASGMGSSESVTVYSDIESPRKLLSDVFEIDRNDAVAVDFSNDSAGLESSEFPEPSFSRMYMGNDLSFPGTFYGLAGTYGCTAPPCEVATAGDGRMSSTGTWTFTPDVPDGAMIDLQDGDYLYFGWWLSEPDGLEGDFGFGAISGGSDPFEAGNKFTRGHADWLEGSVVYEGLAAGGYATIDFTGGVPSGATAGSFTATAELTANFGGTGVAEDEHFSISGRVTDFMDADDGDPLGDWSVDLERTDLVAGSASFGGGATGAELGQSTGEGSWEGAFFGNGRVDGQPGSVAGTFDAHLPAARISGGFGARNTAPDE